jgi:hypothetical protein
VGVSAEFGQAARRSTFHERGGSSARSTSPSTAAPVSVRGAKLRGRGAECGALAIGQRARHRARGPGEALDVHAYLHVGHRDQRDIAGMRQVELQFRAQ